MRWEVKQPKMYQTVSGIQMTEVLILLSGRP